MFVEEKCITYIYVVRQIHSVHSCAILSDNLKSSWWLLDSIP